MSSEPSEEAPKRARDAAATREALLSAARVLFAERGYDRATLRDVGERAGVDPALIARYFGGKEGLYLAVFASEPPPDVAGGPEAIAERMMRRWDEGGPGPTTQALIRSELDEGVRARMLERFDERFVGPLVEEFTAAGLSNPRLRAQITLAAMVGIGVVRAGGGLPELASVPREEILAILGPALRQLVEPEAE